MTARDGRCIHVLVMGVAGSGKSTVAAGLSGRLGLEMIEGDKLHPAANVEKMRNGIPLTDDDRRPWLESLASLLADRHSQGRATVLACSALRHSYRDTIRAAVPAGETYVIELDADASMLRARMAHRTGHFMPASLLDSQLATLEPLADDETGMTVDGSAPLHVVIGTASRAIGAWKGDQ